MGNKFIAAIKCFIRHPTGAMGVMMGSQDQEAIELVKKSCPEVDVESIGYYIGILLAIFFLLLGMSAYIIQMLYNWAW